MREVDIARMIDAIAVDAPKTTALEMLTLMPEVAAHSTRHTRFWTNGMWSNER